MRRLVLIVLLLTACTRDRNAQCAPFVYDPATHACVCPPGSTPVAEAGTCESIDAGVCIPADEVCNGMDDDCDGAIDGLGATCPESPGVERGACVDGACTIEACAAGRGDCDDVTLNGCEVDLRAHPLNCGACDAPCAETEACGDSICQEPPFVRRVWHVPNAAPGSIARTSGGWIVAGRFSAIATFGAISLRAVGESEFFVARLDDDGTWRWAVASDGAAGYGELVATGPDGRVVVSGFVEAGGSIAGALAVARTYFLAGISESGAWTGAEFLNSWSMVSAIGIDDLGVTTILGTTRVPVTEEDVRVARYDAELRLISDQTNAKPGPQALETGVVAPDGRAYAVDASTAFLALSADGRTSAELGITAGYQTHFTDAVLVGSAVVLGGFTYSSASEPVSVGRRTSTGTGPGLFAWVPRDATSAGSGATWVRRYDELGDLDARCVAPVRGGAVTTTSGITSRRFALARIDAAGDVVWSRDLGNGPSEVDDCAASGTGDVMVAAVTGPDPLSIGSHSVVPSSASDGVLVLVAVEP